MLLQHLGEYVKYVILKDALGLALADKVNIALDIKLRKVKKIVKYATGSRHSIPTLAQIYLFIHLQTIRKKSTRNIIFISSGSIFGESFNVCMD